MENQLADLEKSFKTSGIYEDIYRTYQAAGGEDVWAVTTQDFTYYAATLPKEKADLFCYLESERLKDVLDSLTPGEVASEKKVVLKERKQEFDDNPARALFEKRHSLAFSENPYHYPVAGLASEIPSISLKDIQEFKHKYYRPNNCVVVIVGDLQVDRLFTAMDNYFGDIPAGGPHLHSIEKDPPRLKEQRITMESAHDSVLTFSFIKPSFPHRNDIISKVVASLLTRGNESRLYEDLITEKMIVTRVSAGSGPGERFDSLFTITAVAKGPEHLNNIEISILEHLERLKTETISIEELLRAKETYEADTTEYVTSAINPLGMTLLRHQLIHGDWSLILKSMDDCRTVSSEEISQFAKKYFTKDNRLVTILKGIKPLTASVF